MKTLSVILSVGLFTLTILTVPQVTAQTSPSVAKDSRCFELRTYYAAPGKFEAMNARFRDHTCKLFKKHGMELVGFWIPEDKDKGAENTMVYIVAHKSRAEAKKSWAAFVNDPEWKKARDESEANGKLVDKVESVYLSATDYSPMK
ncbi:MAG: NIPSNAP family protein [Verrucomicrobiae bacterium]|nr:NIPSNAP family protein [Verrucomicrobiae bacterium]